MDTQTPVKIQLTTNVRIDDEIETYELTVFGTRYEKGNTIYLTYDEVQEEGTINTVVKILKDEAVILRNGLIKMRLAFSLSELKQGTHESTLGTIFLTTDTKILSHEEGKLSLAYDLSMQGTLAGYYEMDLEYKEDKL
ncbi:DUF1934 domain-containing protein [Lederbergia wuyishanensis]|uniref:Uncharacterized beta-barrel protein YwiB (DUF1934 family) n=1 Tax=Lederbergia wuyishanensis TaxID=1347903 RepID=A0ABU0D3H2_9BACI|nr:DUF1934 family protein [Lederbergia wuyishanensis]MCJ8007883.1 DUF1934 family protein [Lederbergia wuyishanensis]MDQ0342950.1 uncharacterized beta-barrel protein YwiB (DUF1934 family) [Lederbergia wuyishanensis]